MFVRIISYISTGCLLFFSLVSCTVIDDYMLGKDNTPHPRKLKEIYAKVKLQELWVSGVGAFHKQYAYLKLQPVRIGQQIYTASAQGVVEALSVKQGQVLWKQVLKSGIVSGPVVQGQLLALGTDRATVMVMNAKNGQPLWETNVSSDVLSKPLFDGHEVIVKTVDGTVYAINKKNGEIVWSYLHGSPHLILKASSSPVAVDNLVLSGFSDGKLVALNRDTGHEVWQKSIAYPNGSSDVDSLIDIDADPILQDNRVYLATYQGFTGAFSIEQGDFIWHKPASVYKNIAISGDALYFSDANDVVWAYDKSTGQVKWQQVNLKARGITEPVIFDNRIIIGDKLGFLHILSTKTGALIGRLELKSAIDIAPTARGHHIEVLTRDGRLHHIRVN